MAASASNIARGSIGSDASRRKTADRTTFSSARGALVPFAGFGSFIAVVQLYENCLLLGDVSVFNFSLYGSIAQLVALAALAALGFARSWTPPVALVQASGALLAVGLAANVFGGDAVLSAAGATAAGAAASVLAVAWGGRVAAQSPRSIFLFVLGALLASAVLSLACSAAPEALAAFCAIVLPLASAVLYTVDHLNAASGIETPKPAAARPLPWPFLVILGACCLVSSLFVGATLNPYSFQSASVSHYMHLFTIVAFAAMLAAAFSARRPRAQLLFIAALAMLLCGLFLFSSGLLGSIIMPLGLILTAKTCCVALCWITLATLSRTSGLPVAALFGCGLIVGNGTLGRSVGMLVNSHSGLSYPDIALAASVCIVAFTLFYAFMVATHPSANDALSPSQPPAPAPAPVETPVERPKAKGPARPRQTAHELVEQARRMQERKLDSCNLTKQEKRVAHLILQGKTYQQIAEDCRIAERTVKFHAKNVYQKVGVTTRRDFELKMLSDD